MKQKKRKSTNLIKEIILGEIGAGVLFIILQFCMGFMTKGNVFSLFGGNCLFILGLASIFDGVKRILKRKKKS